MPYVKNRRYRRPRRFNKPRRKTAVRTRRPLRRRTTRLPPRISAGMPLTMLKKLRYYTQITLNPAADTPAVYNFYANNVYNPQGYEGSAGHQPLYFDQLMAFYGYSTVLGSKCQLMLIPSTTTNTSPIAYAAVTCQRQPMASNTFSSSNYDFDHWNEYVTKTKVQMSNWAIQSNAPKKSQFITTSRYSARKIWGTNPKALVADYEHANTSGSGPAAANNVYHSVVAMAPDIVSDPPALVYGVLIEYIVLFHGRKVIGQS